MEKNIKLDYKKKYKDLYQPKITGMLIDIAAIPFLMVDGKGNPNEEDGDYSKAMQLLYGITFTIKIKGMDYSRKEDFLCTSMLRLPEYVTEDVFAWACEEFHKKHPEADINRVRMEWYEEGLCAQILHKGSYDEEPASLKKLHTFIEENGCCVDIGSTAASGQLRKHHEIYLGDPRKCKPENLKTVLRIPVRKQ